MIKRISTLTIVALMAVFLWGCAQPVNNLRNQPVPVTVKSSSTVKAAIMGAGRSGGWQMRNEKPGVIIASIHVRRHSATVRIDYDATSYSISYQSSYNLGYNPSTNKINRHYSKWVANLDRAIQARLHQPS